MNLYVIRHGEVDINVKGQLNGRNDSILTENGMKQAEGASKIVQQLNLDLIICSPLKRTKQTCDLVNVKGIPVIFDERIIERDSNSMMYKIKKDVDLDYFYNPANNIVFEDCEGFKSILDRVSLFLKDVKEIYSKQNILIVTHHDVCKAIYACINDKIDTKEIISFNQNNCEIIKYNFL